MEKQKVYIIREYEWTDGDTSCEEYIDSIWSRLDDAKRRLDDLVNEFIRQEWYRYWTIPNEDYAIILEEDGKTVRIGEDIDKQEYCCYISEFNVDPEMEDFRGP